MSVEGETGSARVGISLEEAPEGRREYGVGGRAAAAGVEGEATQVLQGRHRSPQRPSDVDGAEGVTLVVDPHLS